MDGLRDQTDVELHLLGDCDNKDGLRDQTDVDLQLLGDCDDMDGLRDQTDVGHLRRYGWTARPM